jgi:hypothetical protein
LSTFDQSKCIQNPVAALVRDESGEERVEVLLPIVSISEEGWATALSAAVQALARELLRRGDHGRTRLELEESILGHLDRDVMAASVARRFLERLAREIKAHLEVDLDLRIGRVDAAPSGLIKLFFVTVRPRECCDGLQLHDLYRPSRQHRAIARPDGSNAGLGMGSPLQ